MTSNWATVTAVTDGEVPNAFDYAPLEGTKLSNYDIMVVTGKIAVVRADLDMARIAWDYTAPFAYDGTEKTVLLTGCPSTVTPIYTDNAKTEEGVYTAKATFLYDVANYNAPAPVADCVWEIVKARRMTFSVKFDANGGTCSTASKQYSSGEMLGTLPTATKNGYTFDGWYTAASGGTKESSSTVVTGNVTLYAHWTAVPVPVPVPQVLVDETEAHVDVRGGEVAPYEKAAAVYDGYLHDAAGNVAGTVQVKVAKGKADRKTGAFAAKATATVQLADGSKKLSFKGGVADAAGGVTEMADKNGNVLAASLGVNGLGGEFRRSGGVSYRIDGARNVFSAKDKETKESVKAIENAWVGAVNVVEGDMALAVSIAKKGKVKVSGTVGGAKVSATSQLLVGDGGVCCVPVVITKKANLAFNLWLLPDGGVELAGLDGVEAGRAGTLKPGAAFSIEDGGVFADVLPGLLDEFLPYGVPVAANGKKWVVAPDEKGKAAKAGKIKLVDDDPVDVQDSANPSGLKLAYTAKAGTFKGSFKAYTLVNGKIKSYTVNVTGVMLGDKALGTATLKKPAVSFPIAIE